MASSHQECLGSNLIRCSSHDTYKQDISGTNFVPVAVNAVTGNSKPGDGQAIERSFHNPTRTPKSKWVLFSQLYRLMEQHFPNGGLSRIATARILNRKRRQRVLNMRRVASSDTIEDKRPLNRGYGESSHMRRGLWHKDTQSAPVLGSLHRVRG